MIKPCRLKNWVVITRGDEIQLLIGFLIQIFQFEDGNSCWGWWSRSFAAAGHPGGANECCSSPLNPPPPQSPSPPALSLISTSTLMQNMRQLARQEWSLVFCVSRSRSLTRWTSQSKKPFAFSCCRSSLRSSNGSFYRLYTEIVERHCDTQATFRLQLLRCETDVKSLPFFSPLKSIFALWSRFIFIIAPLLEPQYCCKREGNFPKARDCGMYLPERLQLK